MVFNSISFAVFFTCFFLIYWLVLNKNLKIQNAFILLGSYFFYAWWDWRFLSLIIGSSIVFYYLAHAIATATLERKRRVLSISGLVIGIGILLFFKYYNFLAISLSQSLSLIGLRLPVHTLNIILPLGISFYTFRLLSYLMDVRLGKIHPVQDIILFSIYISFFPCVFAGPIERAGHFIPQLDRSRVFDYEMGADGMRQILLGFFKKLVIADNCAPVQNHIFELYPTLPSSSLFLGAFIFTIQIYADFSGYSDMAIGFSKLLGFNISPNFNSPFFSKNIAEFWQKWHISLTSWVNDYVFTPLSIAFRNLGKTGMAIAIFINFLIVGLWHGASWTFVFFGFLQGCFLMPLVLKGTIFKKKKGERVTLFSSIRDALAMVITFLLIMFSCIFFRSESLTKAFDFIGHMFTLSIFSFPENHAKYFPFLIVFLFALLMITEWIQRGKAHAFDFSQWKNPWQRHSIYFSVILIILLLGRFNNTVFIYNQF